MIKGLGVELHDVGVAAFVIRVTGLALGRLDFRPFAVETGFLADVRSNLLMTLETQPPLARFRERLVTAFAGLFELRVRLHDVAGIDQLFE